MRHRIIRQREYYSLDDHNGEVWGWRGRLLEGCGGLVQVVEDLVGRRGCFGISFDVQWNAGPGRQKTQRFEQRSCRFVSEMNHCAGSEERTMGHIATKPSTITDWTPPVAVGPEYARELREEGRKSVA